MVDVDPEGRKTDLKLKYVSHDLKIVNNTNQYEKKIFIDIQYLI